MSIILHFYRERATSRNWVYDVYGIECACSVLLSLERMKMENHVRYRVVRRNETVAHVRRFLVEQSSRSPDLIEVLLSLDG